MKALGSSVQAQESLLEAALAGPVNPLVGSIWTRSVTDAGRWKECRAGMDRLKDRLWVEAASEYVRALATARRTSEFDGFVSGSRDRLRADVLTWGAVGNALENIGRPRGMHQWMSDWRTRDGCACGC
jgi:hypothetical protein